MPDPCTRVVILAGGMSSRMKRSSTSSPIRSANLLKQAENITKGMIGVGGKERPLIDYLLFNASRAGIQDVVVVVGEHDTSIREHYGRSERGNRFHGLTISYAVQRIAAGRSKPAGTADALLQAVRVKPEWKGSSFIVCNSDNFYSARVFSMLANDESPNALIDYDRSGLEFDEQRIAQFGITRKGEDGFVREIIEKPPPELIDALRREDGVVHVTMNIFKLHYGTILPYLERCPEDPVREEKELPVAVNMMVKEFPKSLKAIPIREHVPDLTYKEDIDTMQRYLAEHFGTLNWEANS